MKYKLPEPGICIEDTDLAGEATFTHAFTAEQMHQAYAAGREAMRGEAAKLMRKPTRNALSAWVAREIRRIK
jgi:hypothetical protein